MLRSRLSSFVAVRLLGAEPIGGGSRLEGAIWRRPDCAQRTDCVQSRFGGDFARPDDGAPLFEGLKICSEFAYMHKKSYICI